MHMLTSTSHRCAQKEEKQQIKEAVNALGLAKY